MLTTSLGITPILTPMSAAEGSTTPRRGFIIQGRTVRFYVNGIETDRRTFEEDAPVRVIAKKPATRFIFGAAPRPIQSKTGQ